MEVAIMSLCAREQKDLDSIAIRLAAADPGLASLLGMFGQLAAGEEMPWHERSGLIRPLAARGRRRRQARRRRLRAASERRSENWLRIALLVCYLAFFGLILGTLVSLPDHPECAHPEMASCATRAPVRAPLGPGK
jgi:hypothetical protein